jgi:hypothetical protein
MSKTAVIFSVRPPKLRVQNAFATSRSGYNNAISPAVRWASASHHLSLVVSAAVIASATHFPASPNRPTPRAALARSRQASWGTWTPCAYLGWSTERFDTVDVKKAKALLEELA